MALGVAWAKMCRWKKGRRKTERSLCSIGINKVLTAGQMPPIMISDLSYPMKLRNALVAAAALASIVAPASALAGSGTCTPCQKYADGNYYVKCQGSMYGGTVYKKCGN